MKNIIQITPWIIILILLAYMNQCTTRGKKVSEIVYKDSIQIRDSISAPIYVTGPTVYKPVPYEVIIYDTLTHDTTLNEHLSYLDYMAIKKFSLALPDTAPTYQVNLEIQYNSIKKWSYTGTYFEKWKIKEVTKYEILKPKRALFIGAILTADRNQYFGVSPSIILKTKKNTLFTLGYDILNKNLSTGILIKL